MSDTRPAEPLISVGELCKRFGFKERTVRQYVKANLIPFYRFEGRIRFRESEIQAWIATHRVEPRKRRSA